jgi:hypothetical protein
VSNKTTNPTLEAATERYRARVVVLNEPKISRAVPLEETIRAALVGLPVTLEELRPMLGMTHDAAMPRLIKQDPSLILDVYVQGLLFGYYLAREEWIDTKGTKGTE